MTLYTMDFNENNRPEKNARIERHESDIEATKSFDLEDWDLDDGVYFKGWEEEDFGDCWLILYGEPETDEDGFAEINGIKCKVKKPGTHPGGRCYWLTPVEAVKIPVFEIED